MNVFFDFIHQANNASNGRPQVTFPLVEKHDGYAEMNDATGRTVQRETGARAYNSSGYCTQFGAGNWRTLFRGGVNGDCSALHLNRSTFRLETWQVELTLNSTHYRKLKDQALFVRPQEASKQSF